MEYTLDCLENVPVRIDKYISDKLPDLSRSYIQQLIESGNIFVNDKELTKANYKCKNGDHIYIQYEEPRELDVIPEDIPLNIVYEDSDIVIVNKPKNMVVHPAAGHTNGTLVNALLFHCKDLSSINGVIRPGIVHRIDRNTTGILVVCKNDNAHKMLAKQLKEHSITRKYHAICCGNIKEDEGTINAPIGRHPIDRKKMAVNKKNGRQAVTHYRVLERLNNNYTYIECELETGRTHQIRVHMASIGHPILGDDVYGPKNPRIKDLEGQTLHAKTLGFIHPTTNRYVEFDSELPEYFKELLKKLA